MAKKWVVGASAAVLVLIIISAAYNSHKERILMEKGIAQAQADAEQQARLDKIAQQAKEASDKKKFDELPTDAKARIQFARL
jgi:hypothetical protein